MQNKEKENNKKSFFLLKADEISSKDSSNIMFPRRNIRFIEDQLREEKKRKVNNLHARCGFFFLHSFHR